MGPISTLSSPAGHSRAGAPDQSVHDASARAAEMMSSPLVQPISAVVVSEP